MTQDVERDHLTVEDYAYVQMTQGVTNRRKVHPLFLPEVFLLELVYAAHNWHTSHSKNAVFLGKTTDAQSVRPFRTTARHLAVLQATSSRRDKPWKSRLLMRVHRSRPLSKNQSRRIRGETSRITVTAGHFGSFVSPRVSAYHGSRLRELRIRSQAERNFGCS